MSVGLAAFASAQTAQNIRQDVDIGVLAKLQSQQKQEGRAAVTLIEGSGLRGGPEPGKGQRVDVSV